MTAEEAANRVGILRAALAAGKDNPPPKKSEKLDLPAHLRDGVDPGEIRARVAALRDALGGRWRRGSPPPIPHPRAEQAAAPALDGWIS